MPTFIAASQFYAHEHEPASYKLNLPVNLRISGLLLENLRTQSYRLYVNQRSKCDASYELARTMTRHGVKAYPGHEATMDEIKIGLVDDTHQALNDFYTDVVRTLPGFDKLSQSGCVAAMFERAFFSVLYYIIHNRMLINDEWFYQLPGGIQFTTRILKRLTTNFAIMINYLVMVRDLYLTEREMALLVPCIFTLSFGL